MQIIVQVIDRNICYPTAHTSYYPITGIMLFCREYANIPASCVTGTSISVPTSKCYLAFKVINIIVEDLHEPHFPQKFTDIFL